jgi:hypothetical protein
MSNQTIANRTLENKGVLYDLISLVYKHNGRVGNQVFKALVQMHFGQEPADIFEHAVSFKFAKISDLKSFSNELYNAKNMHTTFILPLGGDCFCFDLGKYITFDTFAECQEKNPNIKLQEIIEDSGKYKTLVRAFSAKAVLEPCPQFRYPFCEQMSRFTKYTTSYPSNCLENLKNKKLTINYDWFVQNYKQFDNVEDAIQKFCASLVSASADFNNYTVYSGDMIVPKSIGANYHLTDFMPFVKAELTVLINKQYTKEQAKKDYEKGRELIEQGNALVAAAMAFYTSQV